MTQRLETLDDRFAGSEGVNGHAGCSFRILCRIQLVKRDKLALTPLPTVKATGTFLYVGVGRLTTTQRDTLSGENGPLARVAEGAELVEILFRAGLTLRRVYELAFNAKHRGAKVVTIPAMNTAERLGVGSVSTLFRLLAVILLRGIELAKPFDYPLKGHSWASFCCPVLCSSTQSSGVEIKVKQ